MDLANAVLLLLQPYVLSPIRSSMHSIAWRICIGSGFHVVCKYANVFMQETIVSVYVEIECSSFTYERLTVALFTGGKKPVAVEEIPTLQNITQRHFS